MKTIAVLTDFSERAAHATRLAMNIAKKMKANILLFSLSEVPAPNMQLAGAEPGYDGDDDNAGNAQALAEYARNMNLDLKMKTFPGAFLPEISYNSESTEMVDVMTAIVNNSNVALVVIPPDGDDLAAYMLSPHCRRIIAWANMPVLVVPESAAIRNFEKIAFVTTLHPEDILSVTELGRLIEAFAAELMVAHLNEYPDDTGRIVAEKTMNNALCKNLDCNGVYFKSIRDDRPDKNWDWLKANKKTELLAIVQQPADQMKKFFNRGRATHATHHITIPVMVLPKRP